MAIPVLASALALAEFAPAIAKWLGGDEAESAAQQAVDIAHKVTGAKQTEAAADALRNNPQLLVQFQQQIHTLHNEREQRNLKDRLDARARDIALANVGRHNLRADIMVVSAALGLIMCLLALGYYRDNLPGEAVGIISTIAGIFGACLKDAYAFEFGSSRGSKLKDDRVTAALLGRLPS